MLHLQYQNKELTQTGQSRPTQVFGIYHGFLITSCISDKPETNNLHKLVQHHQIMANPLLEQLKVGAFV